MKIKNFSIFVLTITVLCSSIVLAAPAELSARKTGNQIDVYIGSELFTSYKFSPDLKRPYFFPVNGPVSGVSLTTESSEPYPHHNSLFFGCDRVAGGNYWQDINERGQILSIEPKIVISSGPEIFIIDTCMWKQPGKEPVLVDAREIRISAPTEELRYIDFAVIVKAPYNDVDIQKTNHSLFSVRMAAQYSVKSGGTLVNAQGLKSEKGTFGVASPWCDYYHPKSSDVPAEEGIAIFQHPSNLWFPCKWFTRDYGFFSPTPMYWPENGKSTVIEKAKPVSLQYRVVVHAGSTAKAKIADLYDTYSKTFHIDDTQQLDNILSDISDYQLGHSRKCFLNLDTMINDNFGSENILESIADKLTALAADSSAVMDTRKYAFDRLSGIASDKHIKSLAPLLKDNELAEFAIFVVERIATPEAAAVLKGAYPTVSENTKIAIIDSLGNMSDKSSVSMLKKIVFEDNTALARAAISALAKINSASARDALYHAAFNVPAKLKSAAVDACLEIAQNASDDTIAAQKICRSILDGPFELKYRSAAMRVMLNITQDTQTAAHMAVRSGKEQIASALINHLQTYPECALFKIALSAVDSYSPAFASGLFDSIRNCDDPQVLSAVIKACSDENKDIKLAALKALGTFSDTAVLKVLYHTAASDPDSQAREVAYESLKSIPCLDVDSSIVNTLSTTDSAGIKTVLIQLVADRHINSAEKVLLKIAETSDKTLTANALKSLSVIGTEQSVAKLLDILCSTSETSQVRRTLYKIIMQEQKSSEAQINSVIKKYRDAEDIQSRIALLELIGQIKTHLSVDILKEALNDTDTNIRRTALKGLSDSSDLDIIAKLISMAAEDKDKTNRILALRASITVVKKLKTDAVKKTQLLSSLLDISPPADQKKAILSALAESPCAESLALAKKYLQDKDIAAEAEMTVKKISEKLKK